MKLISMTDYVLGQNKILIKFVNHERKPLFQNCVNYANFLKQTLELWMFVPCDENGNALDKPNAGMFGYDHVYNNYTKAKDRVLFEGCKINKKLENNSYLIVDKNDIPVWVSWNTSKTIESLLQNDLTLTQTAIK